jgi:hypothetical protein
MPGSFRRHRVRANLSTRPVCRPRLVFSFFLWANGSRDHLIDTVRVSSYCFQKNCNPEPKGSCIQRKRCLDPRPVVGRWRGAVLMCPVAGALGGCLGFSAPSHFRRVFQ